MKGVCAQDGHSKRGWRKLPTEQLYYFNCIIYIVTVIRSVTNRWVGNVARKEYMRNV